jgi:coenzyme F420-reducing hydrogenase beta subunit
LIILYERKDQCYGCAACMNICPKQAITMEADQDGFIYPVINDVCVQCGCCKKVCPFNNVPVDAHEPLATYAAVNRNPARLVTSASGGAFAALAAWVLEKGGVVFGCAFNGEMEPEHICIDQLADIKRVQGSKYVQSRIETTYTEAEKYLQAHRWVLFTGTPCQIAGLKSYLNQDYSNLITADLICHGVPSTAFFKGYIKHLAGKLEGKVIDFKFRDKSNGWGCTGKVVYEKNGKVREKFISSITSYYYSYFLKGDIYRESCYECKYAGGSRQGDFTMGDYWGVEKAHPEIETGQGVSVLLVNSEKGRTMMDKLAEFLSLTQSTFQQVRMQNGQLRQPIAKSDRREAILKMWREGGHQAVAAEYAELNQHQLRVFRMKQFVPQSARRLIKKLLGRS